MPIVVVGYVKHECHGFDHVNWMESNEVSLQVQGAGGDREADEAHRRLRGGRPHLLVCYCLFVCFCLFVIFIYYCANSSNLNTIASF